jgi:agmatine deiminase
MDNNNVLYGGFDKTAPVAARRRMPAEWEPHERTLMAWPVRDSLIWRENYGEICEAYAAIAKAVSRFEAVTMLVNDDTAAMAAAFCGGAAEYVTIAHDDAWCRDTCPTFLTDGENRLSAVNWRFNAWGGKYAPFALDDALARRVIERYRVPYEDSQIVLEGGAIHTDGAGTLLTTDECLLNGNRNPGLSARELEAELRRQLGVSKVIRLKRGLDGDETDGHVDNVACFVKPGVTAAQVCRDSGDPNFEITRENVDALKNASDAAGRRLEVIEIPQPPPRYYRGARLTLSYLNFYIVNGGVILPVFGGDAREADHAATRTLAAIFPNRAIVTVDSAALITEGGSVHCVTRQMPQGLHPQA